jgi:hypothetical protein
VPGCPVREAFARASSRSFTFLKSAEAGERKPKNRTTMTNKKNGRNSFFIRIFIFPFHTETFSAKATLRVEISFPVTDAFIRLSSSLTNPLSPANAGYQDDKIICGEISIENIQEKGALVNTTLG